MIKILVHIDRYNMVEAYRNNKERNKKPFTMVLLDHGAARPSEIAVWKNHIVTLLNRDPSHHGKIVVFTENAAGTISNANRVQNKIRNGKLPTKASIEAGLEEIAAAGRILNVPEAEAHAIAQEGLEEGFDGAIFPILDDLHREHGERVVWIDEAHPLSTHEKGIAFLDTGFFIDPPYGTTSQSEIADWYRENFRKNSEFDRERENNISQALAEQLDDPNIIGGVGVMGYFHTRVVHNLARNGYAARNVFPEREGRNFHFSPNTYLHRMIHFFPDRQITDADVQDALSVGQYTGTLLRSEGRDPATLSIQERNKVGNEILHIRGKARQRELQIFDSSEALGDHNDEIDWAGNDEPDEGPKRSL